MTEGITSSVVLPRWKCPECGHMNVEITARCMNKRYDAEAERYHAIPPVPPNYSLHNFGEYLEKLGLGGTVPPAVVWECSYRRPCDLCSKPGYPHQGGEIRCNDHPLQEANTWIGKRDSMRPSAGAR